jgi:hypothetical protein
MLRPARLAALAVAVVATAAFAAAPASAGTASVTIAGCTLSAPSTGTPPAAVSISPTSARCTVNGVNGTVTTSSATVTFLPDGGALISRITFTLRATVIFVPITCTYEATAVLLPLVRAGPPTWTYHTDSATARRISGSSACDATVTSAVDLSITP